MRRSLLFTDTVRENWGRHDAMADKQRGSRLPMPLFQQTFKAHEKTHDVEQVAARHFDRVYARGYVKGWTA